MTVETPAAAAAWPASDGDPGSRSPAWRSSRPASERGARRRPPFRRNVAALLVLLVGFNAAVLTSSLLAARGYALAFVLVVPGAAALSLTPLRPRETSVRLAWSVGASVLIVMFLGLLMSEVLPYVGDHRPLSTWSLAGAVDLATLAAGAVRSRTADPLEYLAGGSGASYGRFLVAALLALVPLAAAGGAERLDNGDGSALSVAALAAVGCGFVVVTAWTYLIPRWVLSWWLYCAAAATLLGTTMRSNYPFGYDIQTEYRVFSATLAAQAWHVPAHGNAYASMLSITVLPTVLTLVSHVSGVEVFKLVYGLIFSAFPCLVLTTAARWFPLRAALLGSIVVIAQGFFAASIGALARQDVGLLFFALFVVTAFDASLGRRVRQCGVVLAGTGMAVSHYSTAYFACLVVALGYVVLVGTRAHGLLAAWRARLRARPAAARRLHLRSASPAAADGELESRSAPIGRNAVVAAGVASERCGDPPAVGNVPSGIRPPSRAQGSDVPRRVIDRVGRRAQRELRPTFTLPVVALVLGIVYAWNVSITRSAQNVANLVSSLSDQGLQLLPASHGSSLIERVLDADVEPTVLPGSFVPYAQRYYHQHEPWLHPYPASLAAKYPVHLVSMPSIVRHPPSFLPSLLADALPAVNELLLAAIGLGALYLLWRRRRTAPSVALELATTTFGCVCVLAVLRTSGTISSLYNAPRGQVQGSVLFSVGLAALCARLAQMLVRRRVVHALAIAAASLLGAFLLFEYSGLSQYALGGGGPENLVNFGEGYEAYYFTDADMASARWLAATLEPHDVLDADPYGALQLAAVSSFGHVVETLLPSVMEPDAYVYAYSTNLVDGTTRASVGGEASIFSFPLAFLERVKNTVFTTGSTAVYR
ncbi:MAG TPA: hypothetical protein VMD59_02770 [Acidimicrobiales bacterium]|nr:hypothetical protein [Acidimicrobiales bacterium]